MPQIPGELLLHCRAYKPISQVHVPLESNLPDGENVPFPTNGGGDDGAEEDTGMLPMAQLTATTMLGGTVAERDAVGQMYAAQIASSIKGRDAGEKRTLVVGLGLAKAEVDREEFVGIMELVMKVL
jgi:proteasome assembly chaperone 3